MTTSVPTAPRLWLPWVALIAAGITGLAMGEASGLLARLQKVGAPVYSAAALTNWPGLPWQHHTITDAISTWSRHTEYTALRGPALKWLHWHICLDGLFLIPAYGILVWFALRATRYRPRQALWILLPVVILDEAETWWTWLVVDDLSKPPNGALAGILATLTILKWIAGAFVLAAALTRWLPPGSRPQAPGQGPRIWRRHRVQMIAVLVLFVAFVAPLGGPLDQGPDIVRAWADGGGPAQKLIGPAAGILLLCVALWVAGRFAMLDGVEPTRRPRLWWPAVAAAAVIIAAFTVLNLACDFDLGYNLLGPALVLLVVGGVSGILPLLRSHTEIFRSADRTTDLPRANRDRVRYAGRCLAVAPLVALGILLVRAFTGPALLQGDAGIPLGLARRWVAAGVLLAVLIAPLAAWGIAWLEHHRIDSPGPGRRSEYVPFRTGLAVLAVGAAVAVGGSFQPWATGALLRVIGLVASLLATLTVLFGWAQRRVEARMPALLFGRLHRTPILLLSLVALLLAAQLDPGRYHDVSVASIPPPPTEPTGPAAPTGNPINPIDIAFRTWLRSARACAPGPAAAAGGRPAVPLVLVAAPGGGARATYWAASALQMLTNPDAQQRGLGGDRPPATACGERAIFAVSGVSGGGLGAVLWSASRYGASRHGKKVNEMPLDAMTQEEPLAALLAGGLYRDFPRILHGINSIGDQRLEDRARVLEKAWEEVDDRLHDDMMSVAPELKPGLDGNWRPLLLLNGTAVETGCRVVVAPVRASVTGHADGQLTSCRSATGLPDGVSSGRFAVGALDALDYLDAENRGCRRKPDPALRLSTAALLAARFPYLTPTGALVRCPPTGNEGISRASDVDGGYLENTGIALALELWRALEPMVARHNATAPASEPLVAPMLVLADNHYQRVGAAQATGRSAELFAPMAAYLAPHQAHTEPIMLQRALLVLSGPLPGRTLGTLRVGSAACGSTRVFRASPTEHPGIEAPLGWVLSDSTRRNLDKELGNQAGAGLQCAGGQTGEAQKGVTPTARTLDLGPAAPVLPDQVPADKGRAQLAPAGMATVLQMLGGSLNVR